MVPGVTSPTTSYSVLPRSTPESQGVPSAAVAAFLDQLEAGGIELHSMMLLRHGQVLAEGWWAPYTRDGAHLLYSLSKSFTSTAVGLAVAEGRLDPEDLVTSFFPQVDAATVHPRVQRLQVKHLLSMASGHHDDTLDKLRGDDPAAAFLALVPEEEPGSWFTYNNGATLMLSLIVTAVTGERLLEYLRPRLLDPLGIGEAYWSGTESYDQGFSGLHLATEAIARFGQLYLQGGVWQGRRLLPAEWVTTATQAHVDNPREPEPDWRQGYGYQFWRCRHDGYRGDGAYGQFCVVLPQHEVVLVTTAASENMQAILDAAWTHLLPAFSRGATSLPTDSALADRLAGLMLPLVQGSANPDDAGGPSPWATSATAESTESVASTGATEPQQAVRSLVVTEAAEGSGWVLQITDEAFRYEVPCGHGQWRTGEEQFGDRRLTTAACGGWTGPTTFTAEVAYTQTPHRLRLVADVATGVVDCRWLTAPLGPTRGPDLAVAAHR